MTLTDLHESGYRVVKSADVRGPRGASSVLLLTQGRTGKDNNYYHKLSWSFDGKHYTQPVAL